MALVDTADPGAGILVERTGPRPVGDTSSGSVFVTDLPKNFHGGDEALHFALGELFGQFGKIKKIELYMEKGILETENFKGEALVVYHKTKQTGTHDKGDPVYDACTDLDGKVRVLGKRNWRMHCEPAQWQKEGYDVKEKAKLTPCIEIGNLWVYDPTLPMSWFMQMQEAIRQHATEHIASPFVKVDPSQGTATIWCKGAQDAMKFASMMHKSYFLGRKVTATLCRKERPAGDNTQRLPTGELTMQVPSGMEVKTGGGVSLPHLLAAGIIPVTPQMPGAGNDGAKPKPKPKEKPAEEEHEAPVVMGPELPPAPAGLAFVLQEGCHVMLKDLVSKPENNGRRGQVVSFLADMQKYQVRLEDGRLVKLKPENLEAVEPEPPAQPKAKRARKASTAASAAAAEPDDEADADAAEAEASVALDAAQAAAANMAAGNVRHGPEMPDPNVDGFTATVCVDPSLLPKREDPAAEAEQVRKRESSRSRERRQEERIAAAKARLEADKGPRPSWVVSGPPGAAAQAAAGGAGGASARREPEESREELMKMPVSKLKALLQEYGKTARGCCEKRDFVDRLKPPPKE